MRPARTLTAGTPTEPVPSSAVTVAVTCSRPGQPAARAVNSSSCAVDQACVAGDAASSRQRYGSGTLTPWRWSTTGPRSAGGYTDVGVSATEGA